MGAGGKRDISTPIHKNFAAAFPGQQNHIACQFEERPIGEVFFTYLNKINAPGNGAPDALKEGKSSQLPSISDVIK